jgi:NRAMP (natural resistance-associated macrophage protein)-like metal ion transporter
LPPTGCASGSPPIIRMARNRPQGWRKRIGRKLVQSVEDLGPGVITGAADDDPSGIATYSQAGAQFGYGLMWTQLLSYPLMVAIQLVSAHIGRVTGSGLAKNLMQVFPRPVVLFLVGVLLLANIINLGADLSAMAAGAQLVVGGGTHGFVILFALICVALQLFASYRRYAEVLKWLTLSLFAYVAVIIFVHVDWGEALLGLVWPRISGRDALLTIVALLGTTISPYLFFWQSSQEAEEIATTPQHSVRQTPRSARKQFRRMRIDTLLGMAFSELISIAIIVATAATLHAKGITDIGSAAEAAQALRPVAGRFASLLFALGIIGTGLLAVPVLAGSAAFAVSEIRGWKEGLEYKPQQAMRFYAIIVGATFIGVGIAWSNINPIQALVWSAVLNGVCAAPIMVAMMVVAHRPEIMGRFTERAPLMIFGWAAAVVMALASGAMIVTTLI